jgi:hypothetical protein
MLVLELQHGVHVARLSMFIRLISSDPIVIMKQLLGNCYKYFKKTDTEFTVYGEHNAAS